MSEKGLLTVRHLISSAVDTPKRAFVVYSRDECEKHWESYAEQLALGGSGKRPRAYTNLRERMLESLAAVEQPISFGDAISRGEASKILGVHFSFPPRMAKKGEVIGRIVLNERNQRSRCWIFSRASCELDAAKARRKQAAGIKAGRSRNWGDAPLEEPEEYLGKEGRKVFRPHFARERNWKIADEKKRHVHARDGKLACEACKFEFEGRYGRRGYMFAECHHRKHLASAKGEREVTLNDLAVVCSNCHRMLHRLPEITVEQLRESLRPQ